MLTAVQGLFALAGQAAAFVRGAIWTRTAADVEEWSATMPGAETWTSISPETETWTRE